MMMMMSAAARAMGGLRLGYWVVEIGRGVSPSGRDTWRGNRHDGG
jgi:hypothetical protein